jgi:hypothetical protein
VGTNVLLLDNLDRFRLCLVYSSRINELETKEIKQRNDCEIATLSLLNPDNWKDSGSTALTAILGSSLRQTTNGDAALVANKVGVMTGAEHGRKLENLH